MLLAAAPRSNAHKASWPASCELVSRTHTAGFARGARTEQIRADTEFIEGDESDEEEEEAADVDDLGGIDELSPEAAVASEIPESSDAENTEDVE